MDENLFTQEIRSTVEQFIAEHSIVHRENKSMLMCIAQTKQLTKWEKMCAFYIVGFIDGGKKEQ